MNTARFWEYVWPFYSITHERVKKFKYYTRNFRRGNDSVEDEIKEEQKFDLSEQNIDDIFGKEKKLLNS